MTTQPKICLTLTGSTLNEDIELAKKYAPYVDLYELRADCLTDYTLEALRSFPSEAPHPTILTVRKVEDGGKYEGDNQGREAILKQLDAFAYVDLEHNYHPQELESLAKDSNTRIIRSLHDFNASSGEIALKADDLAPDPTEIPKIAFMPKDLNAVTTLFRIAKRLPKRDRILLAMGPQGAATRILASKLGSYLTFTSPKELIQNASQIGHIDPIKLHETYKIRTITEKTAITAVTGWPLKVTSSPEVHRAFYNRDNIDAVLIPMPAESVQEAIELCEELNVKGLAVTVPHKESLIPLLDSIDQSVKSIGAANTVVWKNGKRFGTNTDAAGFTKAICDFLKLKTLNGMKVAIIGAGGAAKAIAYAISEQNAIATIYARNLKKAQEVALPYGFDAKTLDSIEGDPTPDLIVQCTSVGNGSTDPNASPIPSYQFKGTEAIYDLVYKPEETPIMAKARKAGSKAQSGMTMLIAQAEHQHQLFFKN